jgi:hypothetical protein
MAEALDISFTPDNWRTLWSDLPDLDLISRSLCGGRPDWDGQSAAWRRCAPLGFKFAIALGRFLPLGSPQAACLPEEFSPLGPWAR